MDPKSIVKSLERCPAFRKEVSNRQCGYLSSGNPSVADAIRTLKHEQFVVGCLEALPEFWRFMSELLGWTAAKVPYTNSSVGAAQEVLLAEPGAPEAIAELNPEDIKLYHFIRDDCDGLFVNLVLLC